MPIRALPNGRPIPPHSLVAIDRNSGRHRPESVVVFNRNSWSPSTGTGGRLQSKRLVVFNRNSWSPSAGVRTPSRLAASEGFRNWAGAVTNHLVVGRPLSLSGRPQGLGQGGFRDTWLFPNAEVRRWRPIGSSGPAGGTRHRRGQAANSWPLSARLARNESHVGHPISQAFQNGI